MTAINGTMVERMTRWTDPNPVQGDIARKYVRLVVEGECDIVGTEVDKEGNLILANARDPEGRWWPIEIFYHPACERCEYRVASGDPEWTMDRKGARRHWRPIVVAEGRKWAPLDPMADRASVPTLIGVATPNCLAVLDSADEINRRLFSVA